MNHRQYRLRERRPPRDLHVEGLDSEDSQTNRNGPCYLEPWIVNLLLEYKESEPREDGQLGHILKVLNEAKSPPHDEQCPAAILYIADGRYYIQVVVTATATQRSKCSLPQPGFSSILGQFIILQNYRVCFKEAAEVEDCEFYLVLDRFRVMPMKRKEMRQQDCNRESSVLQKIKELWQKSFALQSSNNPESTSASVSEVLREIKEDRFSTLKQNVEACLNLLDSEQLAVYPETKWQMERRQDEMHQNAFTVPAKLLVISAENEAALCQSYPPKPPQASDINESIQDDDRSTISFFSAAESENLDGSLENPWDIFPGMTLTSSSGTSGTPTSLPHTRQMLLANTAEEEEAVPSNSCTPDFLEPCNYIPHCSSAQPEPVEMVSPSLLPSCSKESLQEPASHESGPMAHRVSKTPDTIESIPCGQPLGNSHTNMCLFSPVCPTISNYSSLGPLPEHAEEEHLTHLQRDKVAMKGNKDKFLDMDSKRIAAKRKLMMHNEKSIETISSSTRISQKAPGQPFTMIFPESSKLERKLVAWKSSFKLVSTPKKSRMDEAQVQHNQTSVHSRCSKRLLEMRTRLVAAEVTTRKPPVLSHGQHGAQQQESVKGAPFHFTYQPPTPELCSQVRSTRISRALLGWSRWVFGNSL